ncbi:polysaccharide pyruvyl transferase family protein (plasmid) [Thioclava sp. 'Guangxiensis']|uniref:polysaccharide pyruvyl transferase family protein n=1 Tax=Thioclava sp. 'Guangxiensis' TaxID=3149044 RepID=UPI0032C41B81
MQETYPSRTSRTRGAGHFARFVLDRRRDIEVFGWFGYGNLGDEAMLVAAEEALPGRVIGTRMAMRVPALTRLLWQAGRPELLVAGGTLINGGTPGWLDYIEHRVAQGTRISFMGTGMAFTEEEIAHKAPAWTRWARLMAQARTVHLRGPDSVAMAARMGIEAQDFGDFAFLLHENAGPGAAPPLVRSGMRGRPRIGLNFGHCLGDQAQFEAAAARLVAALGAAYDLVVHVVVEKDLGPTRRILADAGFAGGERSPDRAGLVVECHYDDPRRFMASVRGCEAYLGLKLHAAGLAMVAGVPTQMIAYKPKARDFMRPLGGREDLLLDLPLDTDLALARIEGMLADPQPARVSARIGAIAARQRAVLNRSYPLGLGEGESRLGTA